MKRTTFLPLALSVVVVAISALPARSVDLESFEFGDGAGTSLSGAVNTANSGNAWVEDEQMFPSDVRNGSYNIVKESTALDNNFLQIANITSGTRYLVARISGWNLGDTIDVANLEEVRFGFLNDDDVDFGSTITAQMMVRRNSDGTVELVGDALGAGSTNISGAAPLTTTRSTPLTLALELNKTSNTYRVFYKDNTNPTQVLGLGTIAPTRDGNSLRFSANNSFSEGSVEYPFDPPDEVFSVDRIALTDTNPFTDLITLDIDRVSGSMTLRNTSGAALTGLESYSITSSTGPFDPTKWKTVTGNYDGGGPGSVDNAAWAVTSSTKTLLSEMFQSGDGGGLSIGQEVVLSVPAGDTWLQSPFEDATMQLNFSGGVTRTVSVNYVGNGGAAWSVGDLNFDNDITAADYSILVQFAETSLAGLTQVEAYRRGDLDGDGINSTFDFVRFKDIYEAANGGTGSFALMVANFNAVPEPGTATLLLVAAGLIAVRRQRREHQVNTIATPVIQDRLMPRSTTVIRLCIVLVSLAAAATVSHAAILEDFPFSDPNTTLLEDAENIPNSGNNWIPSDAMTNSSVLNGAFRIQTDSTALQSNYLDIDNNITSGKAWLVTEIAGWSLSSIVGSDEFDSGELEEVRFAFLDNDSAPFGSTITAQAVFIRNNMGGFNLRGIGPAGGANDLPNSLNLPLTQSNPFTVVVEIDEGSEQYSVYYKDNTDPFTLLGTTNHVSGRNGNSLRFAINNSFAGTGEFFDISRMYVTTDDPLGGPVEPIALTLEVKSNGLVSIVNNTDEAISFDTYRIASPDDSLNFGGWSPLGMLDAVDGGDDVGETWTPSAGADDGVLAESFLLGQSTADPEEIIPLGSAFKIGGSENLTFQYRDTVSGTLVTGLVDYLPVAGIQGDYNNDGIVDAADYTVWRNNLNDPTEADINNNGDGGDVGLSDYTLWKQQYGAPNSGSGGLALNSVPEPSTIAIALMLALPHLVRRRLKSL